MTDHPDDLFRKRILRKLRNLEEENEVIFAFDDDGMVCVKSTDGRFSIRMATLIEDIPEQ